MVSSRLVRKIAAEIVELIHSGVLSRDQHLSAQKLALRFGVSRSPIRGALEWLEEQGYVVQKSNRGYFVAENIDTARAQPVVQDEPSAYLEFANDWLTERIPENVSEQFVLHRYKLTKAQSTDILNRATLEGWAERRQGYGWRLLPVARTNEALEKIYRFRAVIEPAALLEPSYIVDPKIIERQRENMDLFLSGDLEHLSSDRILYLGAGFHEDIALMSGNPFFHQALIRVNKMRLLMEYKTLPDRTQVKRQWLEHRGILDLVERGDMMGASFAMRQHLTHTSSRKRL